MWYDGHDGQPGGGRPRAATPKRKRGEGAANFLELVGSRYEEGGSSLKGAIKKRKVNCGKEDSLVQLNIRQFIQMGPARKVKADQPILSTVQMKRKVGIEGGYSSNNQTGIIPKPKRCKSQGGINLTDINI